MADINKLYQVDRLTHDNYIEWSFRMRILLRKYDVLDSVLVEEEFVEPEEEEIEPEERVEARRKADFTITI
jgi:hypothetical protein